MIKGILFFETGGVQQIGEFNTLAGIIATMKQVLPELEAAEANRILSTISDADLEKMLAARTAQTGETKKL